MTGIRTDAAAESFDASALPREGDILAGKYRVAKIIGKGAMGVVVAAEHLQLRHQVAIKLLLPESCEQPDAVNRFLREARAAVQMRGEHVARVSDVGTLETGAPYMVMDLLLGSDLRNVLELRGRPFPIQEAVGYVLQACEGIAEAHGLGIVHRDLKPANLFLTKRVDGSPLVKVLDFGISKSTQREAPGAGAVSMTSSTALLGSPSYMSPEQVRSAKNVDARTDIWSMGVVLHEFLTGQPPFESQTVAATLAQIAADRPPLLRKVRPDAPMELEQTLLKCLEKDPEQRLPNIAELARALVPFGPAELRGSAERIATVLKDAAPGADARAVPNLGRAAEATIQGSEATTSALGRTRRSGRGRSHAALIATGTLAVLGAVVLYRSLGRPPVSPTDKAALSSTELLAPATPPDPVTSSTANDVRPLAEATASVAATPTAEGRRRISTAEPRAKPSVPRTTTQPGASAPSANRGSKRGDLFNDTQ